MSKTCQETIELMNLYLDGRLSGGQYQELAKHQATCEHCRKRMKDRKSTRLNSSHA